MFGKITPKDRIRERIEAKKLEVLNAELIAMEVSALRRQLAHLESQLDDKPKADEVSTLSGSQLFARLRGPGKVSRIP